MAKTHNRIISLVEYIREKYTAELNGLLLDSAVNSFMAIPGTIVMEIIECWSDYENEFGCLIGYSADVWFKDGSLLKQSHCHVDIEAAGFLDEDEIYCDFYTCHDVSEVLEIKHTTYLDEFLIPKAKLWSVSRTCEEILRFYCPDEMKNKKPVDPKALAKAMGLNILRLPLRKMDEKNSLLVTEDRVLPVIKYNRQDPDEVMIKAGTIIINTVNIRKLTYENNSIAHECYHYAGQRLFNALQKAAHSEFPHLDMEDYQNDAEQATSMQCLEWQAMVGATLLRYPRSLVTADINDELCKFDNETMNQGERYEEAIKNISKKHNLPGGLIKRALRFTGDVAVKGAWNYVDRAFIKPFGFDTTNGQGPATFVISSLELMRLYAENKHLREAMQRGALVYADGHVCVNSPEFVTDGPVKKQLTPKALDYVDACCLKFYRDYRVKANGEYQRGILFCDENQLQAQCSLFESSGNNKQLIDLAFDVFEKIHALPYAFAETLKAHRENLGLTQEELAENAQMDRVTISRIEKRMTTEYRMETVIKLAIGLRLSRQFAFDFFKKAGFSPDATPAGYAIDFIISNLQTIKLEMAGSLSNEYYAIAKSADTANAIAAFGKLEEKSKQRQSNQVI